MEANYKFFRTKDGVSFYAAVSVHIASCASHTIAWAAKAAPLRHIYDIVINNGVEVAYRQHLSLGGDAKCVEILELSEVVVDTTPDAVECATAIATWKALGHDEKEALILYDGKWGVSF